jgi:hypothetical protein
MVFIYEFYSTYSTSGMEYGRQEQGKESLKVQAYQGGS